MSDTKDLGEARKRLALFIQQQRAVRECPPDVDTIKHDDVAPGADKPVTGIQLVGGTVTYIFAQPVIMVPSEAEES